MLEFQPKTPVQAVILAEAHVKALGFGFMSPIAFVSEHSFDGENLVTAAVFPSTKLREKELLPGLKLRSGSSVIEIIRIIPTNREVVYKNNRGGTFRMPSEKFVKLALQQGYKKIWNVTLFLQTLKNLLRPVMDAVPIMWILRWVLGMLRNKNKKWFTNSVPKEVGKL